MAPVLVLVHSETVLVLEGMMNRVGAHSADPWTESLTEGLIEYEYREAEYEYEERPTSE